jgi:methylthioribose-1-phosphate isomerase
MSNDNAPTLEAIRYSRGSLQLLDQLQLPFAFQYLEINTCEDGWATIREMKVRGAPAIAIAAALSLCVEATSRIGTGTLATSGDAAQWLLERLEYVRTSRPTAVNLFNECDR